MSDQSRKSGAVQSADVLDLTRSIRELEVRNPAAAVANDKSLSALLVCQDGTSVKWGPRWLRQAGLETNHVADPDVVLDSARSTTPDVIIVEAGLSVNSGRQLYEELSDAADLTMPVIVLCSNPKETLAASQADVFDVVRKPFEWQLISGRAMKAVKIARTAAELDEARMSLSTAVELADNARKHLRSREMFEPITGLPNKSKFIELLGRGMSASDRDNNLLAVFVIDFNRFGLVIEAMGQETANLVLAEIGVRLGQCLSDAGSVQAHAAGLRTAASASLGSSSFGLMLTGSAETDELKVLQERLTESLSRPVQVSGQTVYLSACVGVAVYPQDAGDADSLLQRATNAMHDAERRGGGFRYHCADTDAAAVRRLKIEHMLHEAFDRNELTLMYQPLTHVESGRIVGAEALLRWEQPDQSYIPPSEFVPIAEESGLMIRIGEFVLDEACKQLKTWGIEKDSSFRMSVNVSRCQLMNGGFVNTVERLLEKYGVSPSCLDLELSERGVLSGDHDVIEQLHELKKLGVKISIDDFGTGDSAIAYLTELPIDVLKIDRSYIGGLMDGGKVATVTSAMVALGQSLNLTVIAEGVETAEQLSILQNLDCDEYQGFLLSPAIPSEGFMALMHKSRKK